MMPRNAIAEIAKLIGRELESGAAPSEGALATGPMLAEAGPTNEVAERLFAEAHRKRPNYHMIEAYAFMLEGALGTLRLQANGGDVDAEHAIDEVRNRVDQAVGKSDVAPEISVEETLLTLRHENLVDVSLRQQHRSGWISACDRLDRFVTPPTLLRVQPAAE
jgi:hypothetical protein